MLSASSVPEVPSLSPRHSPTAIDMVKIWVALALAAATTVSAQTFRRTAACGAGSFGCLFPPTETEFIAGQVRTFPSRA